jgi:EAL domain-containing protein (putative c-di-GMP-specific phosphodiesterase class I)
LQLDRSWFTGVRNSEVARKICRAGSSHAEALGLTAVATGVDDRKQHHLMLGMGYRYGTGDLYPAIESDITEPRHVRAPG